MLSRELWIHLIPSLQVDVQRGQTVMHGSPLQPGAQVPQPPHQHRSMHPESELEDI